LNAQNAQNFSANVLQTVGGYLDARNAQSFSVNSLQTVKGWLNAKNTRNFSAKDLMEVQSIYLKKSNFLEYWQNNTFDWDKAYKDNRLILKGELREKVVWR